MDAPPKRRRATAVARRRGLRGGRPVKYPRTVPPVEQALPPPLRGGKTPVEWTVPPAVWEKFCRLFASGVPLARAAEACSLAHVTVRDWFRRGARGQEPYRSQVEKAIASRVTMLARAMERGLDRDPWEWCRRVFPDDFPREAPMAGAQVVVVVEGEPHRRGTVIELHDPSAVAEVSADAGADEVRGEPGALQARGGGTPER